MVGLSRLEHFLTLPIRRNIQKRFTKNQIRYMAFGMSLLTCVLDASVVTFSLFTDKFIKHLHYNQVDINIISGAMLVGLYLTLPLLGYLADAHGSVLLAIIGISLTPGYLLALCVYENHLNFWFMALAFGLIGVGTSSSYFCSLLTCAKVFPDRKGLGISLPVTFYGLSSLVLTWVFHLPIFSTEDGQISIQKVFSGLAILYAISGVINWVSSVVVSIEKEIVFAKLLDEERAQNQYGSTDTTLSEDGILDAPLVSELSHEEKFKAFLRDPSMRLMFLALFLLTGPLELYISNLGSITTVLNGGDVGYQLGVFSLSSTLTRISMGVLSDRIGTLNGNVNLVLGFGVGLATLGFALVAYGGVPMDIISFLIGIAYGAVFTLFPTLSAIIWGVEILGSTWGLFLSAPAIGALVFGLFYAREYDSFCPEIGCLTWTFSGFCLLFVMSGLFIKIGQRKF